MFLLLKSVIECLNLAKLWIVYPGKDKYKIHKNILVLPLVVVKRILVFIATAYFLSG